jgi:hypothetical protein
MLKIEEAMEKGKDAFRAALANMSDEEVREVARKPALCSILLVRVLAMLRKLLAPQEYPVDWFVNAASLLDDALQGPDKRRVAELAQARNVPQLLDALKWRIQSDAPPAPPPPSTLIASADGIYADPNADTADFLGGS